MPYAQAVERVTAALKEESFGALTELEIRLRLPCIVVVCKEDRGSVVAIVDSISMLGVVETSILELQEGRCPFPA